MTVGIKGAILLRDTLQRRLQGRKFSRQTAISVLTGFSRVRSPSCCVICTPLAAAWVHLGRRDLGRKAFDI
jgi:hypothetical protein